jgi:hypothetical protein
MKLRDDVEVKIRPTASLVHVGSVAWSVTFPVFLW